MTDAELRALAALRESVEHMSGFGGWAISRKAVLLAIDEAVAALASQGYAVTRSEVGLDVERLEHEALEGERARIRREVVEMWAQRGAGYVSMNARTDILAILARLADDPPALCDDEWHRRPHGDGQMCGVCHGDWYSLGAADPEPSDA